MASEISLLAVTFRLPQTCRNIREADRYLRRYLSMLSGSGMMAHTGGIFEGLGPEGQSVHHIHLLLASNISIPTLTGTWAKLTGKSPSCHIKSIYDLMGWVGYIFEKNVAEATRYKLVNHRQHIITKISTFTQGVSTKWLTTNI